MSHEEKFECDIFNRGKSYFHVPRTTVCHIFCRMTNKISYKMAAFLRVFTHKDRIKWRKLVKDVNCVGVLPTRWRRF